MRYKLYIDETSPPLKKVYVREEFLTLTQSLPIAVLLEQFLRVNNFIQNDWFNFPIRKLMEESLLGVSQPTMNNYLSYLVNQRWIEKRKNPFNKWDKKNQYKCNIQKIEKDLQKLGFTLPCYENMVNTYQAEVISHV